MKTHAKQTGKLNGTSFIVVLGILFFTALPLISMEAGNDVSSDSNSLTNQFLPVEPWMLTLTDWNTNSLVVEADNTQEVKEWMLTPKNWGNDHRADITEANDADLEPIDDWMFEPTGWRNGFGGIVHEVVDCDLAMFPLYR